MAPTCPPKGIKMAIARTLACPTDGGRPAILLSDFGISQPRSPAPRRTGRAVFPHQALMPTPAAGIHRQPRGDWESVFRPHMPPKLIMPDNPGRRSRCSPQPGLSHYGLTALSRNHAEETQVFAWSFWVRTSSRGASRSMKDMLRTSLLALPKNPRRNHLRFYCIVTAKPQPWRGVSPTPGGPPHPLPAGTNHPRGAHGFGFLRLRDWL
jgi:hypothetical protein